MAKVRPPVALTADGRAVLTQRDGLHEAVEFRFDWRKTSVWSSIGLEVGFTADHGAVDARS
jgi:hypothetical protein